MKTANDGDIVALARRIDNYQDKIRKLICEIEDSGHSRAQKIADAVDRECFQPASAAHVVKNLLNDPTRWEVRDGSLWHIVATKAANNRSR